MHWLGSLVFIPNSSGSKALTHSSSLSALVLTILTPWSGGLIVLSGTYLYPRGRESASGSIIGELTSFGLIQTHFSFSVPASIIWHACPKLLHRYSEQG